MKFKVGDEVKHKRYGLGEIVYIDKKNTAIPYAVQFETFNKNLHDLGIYGAPKVKICYGMWCEEGNLELYTQQPQKPKPILTEDEKAILRNLPKQYKWIARDKHEDKLFLFSNKPKKREGMGLKQWVGYNPSSFYLFKHLFQFIKWEDSEAYNIEELLKE